MPKTVADKSGHIYF